MILSSDEAVCLVLNLSKNQEVSSITKLNKLIAKLNQYFIPIDINFELNKYGSFNAELAALESNELFEKSSYQLKLSGKTGYRFKLKPKGKSLAEEVITKKISKIMDARELEHFLKDIFESSELSPEELSKEEHKKLLVDVEDRHLLVQRINNVNIELYDLYSEIDAISTETTGGIRLAGLVEYCYQLSNFLKNVRFKNIEEEGYDFEAPMCEYYLLYQLEKTIIPFIKQQVQLEFRNEITINRYYQYTVNEFKKNTSFSLDNPNLFKLIST